MGSKSQKELQDLIVVHTFYVSLLEKHLGHPVPLPADVKQALDSPAKPAEEIQAFKQWLNLLDIAISPPMVRDALRRTQGAETAHSLLRYFVSKTSQRASDRDKMDCVSTHLFRNPDP